MFAACLAIGSRGMAQGTLVYDQQSSTDETQNLSGGAPMQTFQPVGQSFMPSLSAVGFVRLWNYDLLNRNRLGAQVYVNVRSDSITGPILGTSDTVMFPANVGGNTNQGFAGYQTFFFSTPVTVAPGTQYYFEVIASGDNWSIGGPNNYGYAGGDAIEGGSTISGDSFWFREGIIQAPEPSTWALLAVGCGTFLWQRRTRART